MQIDPAEFAALLEALDGSDFTHFQVTKGDTTITVTRGGLDEPVPTPPTPASERISAHATTGVAEGTSVRGPAGHVPTTTGSAHDGGEALGTAVSAPVMGTFYSAPKPGDPDFVRIGDVVEAGTQVAVVEVMKLMTPVLAGVAGTVTAVCVDNGALVDFEQPLFRVREDA